MAKTVGGKVVLIAPDGGLDLAKPEDVEHFLRQGYTEGGEAESSEAYGLATKDMPLAEQIDAGLSETPELTREQAGHAAAETLLGSATAGLVGSRDEQAQLRARLFDEQYPLTSLAAQAAPSVALSVIAPGVGAGAGMAAKGGAFLTRAAAEGSMYAGEQARREGRDFSFSEAAIAGITGEVLGAGINWTAARAVGAGRNLFKGATEKAGARDVDRALEGGWLKDYQVARDADGLASEAARHVASDFDGVIKDFPEVASIGRKRDRIVEVISDNPVGQRRYAVDVLDDLRATRQAIVDTAGEGGGPARRLLTDLDSQIEEFNALANNLADTDGKSIFLQADKLRQSVHEYVQDIAQDIYDDPARAILSKDGLRTLEGLRDRLVGGLKDANVWGEAAADFQKVYNKAFHEKYFPSLKIVNGRLSQVTGKDARGFAVRQAEPGKIARFLRREMNPEETAAGLSAEFTRKHFTDWLDGVEAISLEAADMAPEKVKLMLERVHRLRRSAVIGDRIADAVTRHGQRAAKIDAVGGAAIGFAALGDISGAALGAVLLRRGAQGVRSMHWLGDTLNRLGWFKGKRMNVDALLNQGTEIIDRRIAGVQMRNALKRPAGKFLPEGAPDAHYDLGQGPKMLPPWEREIELGTDEVEFLGPHTLSPADYELLDPPPDLVPPFPLAGPTPPPGGGTAQGLGPAGKARPGASLSRAELTELTTDLRASGKQGEAIADFLDEHAAELRLGQAATELEQPVHVPTAGRMETEVPGAELVDPEPVVAGTLPRPEGTLPRQKAGQDLNVGKVKAFNPKDFPEVKLQDRQADFMAERLHKKSPDRGVTTADWYRGADGKIRYVKVQEDPAHALSEHLANRMLKDFGAKTMASEIFPATIGGKKVLAYATEALPEGYMPLGDVPRLQREAAEQWGREIPLNILFGDWDKLKNPGNTFSNGREIVNLDNGGAGVFHASGEYRFQHLKNPGHMANTAQQKQAALFAHGRAQGALEAAPLGPSDLDRGAKQLDLLGQPEHDFRALKLGAELPKQQQRDAGAPMTRAMFTLGIRERTQLKPLVEQGFQVIQAVKAKWGGWYNYVESQAKELPKAYRRDLVKLLETREQWLAKNIGLLSVAPFAGLAAVNDIEDDMISAEQTGLAELPSEQYEAGVEYFRRDQEKLIGDAVGNMFGGKQTSGQLSSSLVRFRGDQQDIHTAYGEKKARLEALINNPGELTSRLAEGFREMPNEAFAAAAGGVGRMVTFLQGKLPQQPKEWTRRLPPSDHMVYQMAEYWDAATNPRGVLEDLRDTGHITAPQLETLTVLYSDVLYKLQTAIMERLQNGESMSVDASAQAEVILGHTGAVEPAFSLTVAQASAMAYEQAAQVQAVPPASSQGPTRAAPAAPSGLQAVQRPPRA